MKGEELGPLMLDDEMHPPVRRHHRSELWPRILMLVLLLLLLLMPTLLFMDAFMIVMREPSAATAAAMAAKILLLGLASAATCSSRLSGSGKCWLGSACACALLVGLAVPAICIKTFLLHEYAAPASFPIIEGNTSSAAPRVAIIGGGPSGLAALWALRLHAPERDVTIFEMTDSVGGHGTTVHDRGKPIDIGFIFSTPTYALYHALRTRYGHAIGASNISLTFHGDETNGLPRWHNKGGAATSADLAAEIERFREEAAQTTSTLPLAQP